MKSILAILLPLLLLGTSCQKTEYIESSPNQTIAVNIVPGSWRTLNGGKSYTSVISMPEISSNFNERGAVLVYLTFGSQVYEQLPEVYDGIAYSFTTSPGQIEIELQRSDGVSLVNPPSGTITAKIVLIDSRY